MHRDLRIYTLDPNLEPFSDDIDMRMQRYEDRRSSLAVDGSLAEFANGHHFYGFHRENDGWYYREWAPNAEALHLLGDFNGWNRSSHPLRRLNDGDWEIFLPGADALPHNSRVKVAVTHNGWTEDRLPLYTTYTRQDDRSKDFSAVIWAPDQPFAWTDADFVPDRTAAPLIYESHVGMATEEYKVGSYLEFAMKMLPRIKADGYNTVQLMAIMEHPYYGSFGYQVSNFFAAASRYGTPDELKVLVNEAHRLGLTVLLDLVHSHAVKNTAEGINLFDGTVWQFFHAGGEGDHPAWGSKCFDYSRTGVLHFLLSNLKFWLEEYHFDGFRFDGVTSMLYHHHGLGVSFQDNKQYFSMSTDVDAVTYLMLAMDLVHELKPQAICIAEDMSAMPGMCLPLADGGMGFDYRLCMGLPDFFIKTVKEVPFGKWDLHKMYGELVIRRAGEKCIAYLESHDQAIVGDQTMLFRLCGAEMYTSMRCDSNNIIVNAACALHKMLRLIVASAGGDGYLNFMGNEFGHPEWIDFPREGNGYSYHYARRQWSLAEQPELRYHLLGRFDQAMLALLTDYRVMTDPSIRYLRIHQDDQVVAFARGGLIFAFNFHPSNAQTGFFIPAPEHGDYHVVLSTDDGSFGGYGRISGDVNYPTLAKDPTYGDGFAIYLPPQTACVLAPGKPPVAAPAPKAEPQPEPKPKKAAEPKAEPKPKKAAAPKAEAKPKKAAAEPKTAAKPKKAAEPKAEPKPKKAAASKAEAKPKKAAEPKTAAKPKKTAKAAKA